MLFNGICFETDIRVNLCSVVVFLQSFMLLMHAAENWGFWYLQVFITSVMKALMINFNAEGDPW